MKGKSATVVDAAALIEAACAASSKHLSVDVSKDLDIDLGNLCASDDTPVDESSVTGNKNKEKFLEKLNRENIQALFNSIWLLPTVRVEDSILCELPKPGLHLPREKMIPEDKPKTKWEKYAELKGIKNQKKSRMVFDEAEGIYKPRYGYKRGGDDLKDWVIPLSDQADPYADAYEARDQAKKDRIAKNKRQQDNNIMSKQKSSSVAHPQDVRKASLEKGIALSKNSTASLGNFDGKLKNEPRNIKVPNSKKRKFDSNESSTFSGDKERMQNALNKVMSGNSSAVLNTRKATNNFVANEQKSGSSSSKKRGKK